MSVLKAHRTESKTEYVKVACDIYTHTLNFVSRLSSRYSRLLAEDTIRMAFEVVEHTEKASNIYPSDNVRRELREGHLAEARAALAVLDVQLARCYDILLLNPQGCFTTSNGKAVDAQTAKKKLDNMAQTVGELIDKEFGLLTKVLKNNNDKR